MADQIQPAARRLACIDWMRGLACVLMFQTHCYDSWMSPEAKKSSSLIAWSRLGGTLPAPLFIFLAGVSFALVTEKLREKGVERGAIARQTIWRGAEIFGMGLLFRVQEFALGYPRRPRITQRKLLHAKQKPHPKDFRAAPNRLSCDGAAFHSLFSQLFCHQRERHTRQKNKQRRRKR